MRMPFPPPSQIAIAVERDALSAWVLVLARTLEQRCGVKVSVLACDLASNSSQPSFSTLLSLEALVLRRGRACWSDRISPDCLGAYRTRCLDGADLVIDLTESGIAAPASSVLRPAFEGSYGESGLAGVLLMGITPQISLQYTAAGESDPLDIMQGFASLENAKGIGCGMEATWSRLKLMIVAAISGKGMTAAPLEKPASRPRPVRRRDMACYGARMLAHTAARAAYRLCFHAPHWRVGWRLVEPDQDVWSRRDLAGRPWNVLRDPVDHFYADPFPIVWNGKRVIFFEALEHRLQKGIIACSVFDENGKPGPVLPVLEEPWHLSYPFVFEADGDIWMIPEASLSGEVPLYRATDFPLKWERHGTLLADVEAADTTLIRHGGKFWMFAVTREDIGGYSDTLGIWMAARLHGPWKQHPANPVLIHDRLARPGGNMIHRGGQLYRPVQDCREGYGVGLGLARITRLDEERFEQQVETWLGPGPGWPGRKLHTLNRCGDLEVIDGSVFRPKWERAARFIDRLYEPGAAVKA